MNHRPTELEQLESDYYEMKPYLFALGAGLCMYFRAESQLLVLSAVLFAFASVSIFYMRYFNRHYR